jgi:hypothetical protein
VKIKKRLPTVPELVMWLKGYQSGFNEGSFKVMYASRPEEFANASEEEFRKGYEKAFPEGYFIPPEPQ